MASYHVQWKDQEHTVAQQYELDFICLSLLLKTRQNVY